MKPMLKMWLNIQWINCCTLIDIGWSGYSVSEDNQEKVNGKE